MHKNLNRFTQVFFVLLFFMYGSCSSGSESLSDKNVSDELLAMTFSEEELRASFYLEYGTRCVDRLFEYNGSELVNFSSKNAFGPPKGGGAEAGSLDVFVIGEESQAVFFVDGYALQDGQGVDLKVFENPFVLLGGERYFYDFATLEVSADGMIWYGFKPELDPSQDPDVMLGKQNLVGLNPVLVNYVTNPIDPRKTEAGGDGFDLSQARKILDRSSNNPITYRYGSTLLDDEVEIVRYFKILDGGSSLLDSALPFLSNGVDIDAICLFYPVTD